MDWKPLSKRKSRGSIPEKSSTFFYFSHLKQKGRPSGFRDFVTLGNVLFHGNICLRAASRQWRKTS